MNQTFLTTSRTTQTDETRMSDDSFSEKTEEVKSKSERGSVMKDYYNSQAVANAEMFRYRAGFTNAAAMSGEAMPSMPTAFFDTEMLLSELM